jgi:hypothetical protein
MGPEGQEAESGKPRGGSYLDVREPSPGAALFLGVSPESDEREALHCQWHCLLPTIVRGGAKNAPDPSKKVMQKTQKNAKNAKKTHFVCIFTCSHQFFSLFPFFAIMNNQNLTILLFVILLL